MFMSPKLAVMGGIGAVVLALTIRIWWLGGAVEDLELRVDALTATNLACNISQEHLKTTIESQNDKITEFSKQLGITNQALAETAKKNRHLKKDLQVELNKVDIIVNETCNDTINWMLKEAIEPNEEINSDSLD